MKKTVLAHALTVAFSATLVIGGNAYAASNSAGSVGGRAAVGTVITLENKEIGLSRTITVDKAGSYSVPQLPPGNYTLKVKLPNGQIEERVVVVQAGEGSIAHFEDAARVVVTGRVSRIDTKSPESSTVLNKAAIDRLPITRDVTAVALLAPGATRGDTRIGATTLRAGNVPSLGGASPAENVYYINGFNVTNSLNGVAFNQVPFEGIAQQQVKSGGYGPEYGRSLGGVLAVTTKRGTNEWKGGANVIYSPESMEGSSVVGVKGTGNNVWNLQKRPGGTDDLQANIWAGGPLVEDKLFFFGLIQGANIKKETAFASQTEHFKTTTPRFLTKFDWNITDKNLLEFTAFSDKSKDKAKTWKTDVNYSGSTAGQFQGNDEYTTGGENLIAKYTTWLTDDLTVSAMYGVGKYNRKSNIESAGCQFVQDSSISPVKRYGCATVASITDPNANDKRNSLRLDAEWNLGNHGLRFGLDNEEYKVVDGTFAPGPDSTRYIIRNAGVGARLANGYVNDTGSAFKYVEARTFKNGGAFTTKNSAYYLEDNWQVHPNVMLALGVRSESFENLNAEDKTFIKVDNTIAPRLGASWDVGGKSETKVYGSVGRYYIPVMSNTNVRLSGAELDKRDMYRWNGTFSADKFQLPGLGAKLGNTLVSSDGTAGDPRSVVDPDIKPMYQDEYIIGFEQALVDRWKAGLKFTHRKLKKVMDDVCVYQGPYDWALANGYTADQADTIGSAISHCFLYNPGGDLTANVDLGDGKGLTPITIPAKDMGFGQPKRTYNSLEFTFDRAWDGKWSLAGSYVLAFNKGNTEGYVKSDIGQDDAGISQDWDFPGLMEGAEGYLPNDRRHTVKMYGAYQLTPEWRVGGNALIQSGRPLNCLGFYNGNLDVESVQYGSSSFYCNGKPTPRGSQGRLAWTREFSAQLHYAPKWQKGLTFQAEVLNMFNERGITSVEEAGESAMGTVSPTYLQPIGLQAARKFRFTAQYEF